VGRWKAKGQRREPKANSWKRFGHSYVSDRTTATDIALQRNVRFLGASGQADGAKSPKAISDCARLPVTTGVSAQGTPGQENGAVCLPPTMPMKVVCILSWCIRTEFGIHVLYCFMHPIEILAIHNEHRISCFCNCLP
jgi:hypothetical protein